MAKWLMLVGLVCIVVGALLQYAPWTLNWFGKLPGDINIKLERGGVYIPFTSMLIVSVLLTLLINLFKRL